MLEVGNYYTLTSYALVHTYGVEICLSNKAVWAKVHMYLSMLPTKFKHEVVVPPPFTTHGLQHFYSPTASPGVPDLHTNAVNRGDDDGSENRPPLLS